MCDALDMANQTNLARIDEGIRETDCWIQGPHGSVSALYARVRYGLEHRTSFFSISGELRHFAMWGDGGRDRHYVRIQILDSLLPVETQIIDPELGGLFLCRFRCSPHRAMTDEESERDL